MIKLDLNIHEAYALQTYLETTFEAMAEEEEARKELEKALEDGVLGVDDLSDEQIELLKGDEDEETDEAKEQSRRQTIMWSKLLKIKQKLEIELKREVVEVVIPARNKMLGVVEPKGGNDETET